MPHLKKYAPHLKKPVPQVHLAPQEHKRLLHLGPQITKTKGNKNMAACIRTSQFHPWFP